MKILGHIMSKKRFREFDNQETYWKQGTKKYE